MAKIDDGGPAYPIKFTDKSKAEHVQHVFGGMSLRDYFAGQALREYLAVHIGENLQVDEDVVADCAYSMADAMIRARRAQSPAETSYAQAAGRGERQSPADVQAQHLGEFGKS